MNYNKVALKVMKDYQEIIVNDLFAFSIPVLKKHVNKPGDVHYKAEGSRLQGIEVAKVVGKTIDVRPIKCPSSEIITAQFKAYESNKRKK